MPRLFELRTYNAMPGKIGELKARFRDTTVGLFQKHGMDVVAFWEATDGNVDKLIYVLAFPDQQAADASWHAFQVDPDWVQTKKTTEQNGSLVANIESLYMTPTDFSAIS